jgi:uncharacterized protein
MNTALGIAALVVVGGAAVWIALGQGTGGGAGNGSGPGAKEPEQPRKPTTAEVTINGITFTLDLALDDQTRFKGLSGRTKIEDKGGMLFVFPKPQERLEFVMRDCPIPIDVIYLDGSGRVVAWHKMTPEPPRAEDETTKEAPYAGAPEWSATNAKYEARLKKYSSRFSAQFAVEIQGGKTDSLNLKAGQKVTLDVAGLKKMAK